MILRNHGIVCCGDTIESAFDLAFFTVRACEYQVITAVGIHDIYMNDRYSVCQY